MQLPNNEARSSSRGRPKIGIDLLGSDTHPSLLLEAVTELGLSLGSRVDLVIFAKETPSSLPANISCCPAQEVITMEDDPLTAIRRKKGSSLCQGMKMLKEKNIDAFISAGNTGALMAGAKTTLSMIAGIERPALVTLLPTKRKEVAILDVGANVRSSAAQLVQFAYMGIAYQKSRGIEIPRVGLLNIGSEAKKGTLELQLAYQALQKIKERTGYCTFRGNIEGRDVFEGNVDVVVTDGFTGNVLLKTAEGIASFLLSQLEEAHMPEREVSQFKKRLDYSEYPGALLCGVDGIVIKCHGDSSPRAMKRSVVEALNLVENAFLEKIKSRL